MANENLKRLHESLANKNIGFNRTLQEFESDMQDEYNRKELHASLNKIDKGFTRGYDDFSSDMGFVSTPQVSGVLAPEKPKDKNFAIVPEITMPSKSETANIPQNNAIVKPFNQIQRQ